MLVVFLFFCKQETAYEMRISYWSSDVCSSDLRDLEHAILAAHGIAFATQRAQFVFEGIDGCKADLIDRDPCPPDAVHSTSPMRTQKRRRPDADDLCGDR